MPWNCCGVPFGAHAAAGLSLLGKMLNWNSMLGFSLVAFAQRKTKPEKSEKNPMASEDFC
jgi:hypothetical protein